MEEIQAQIEKLKNELQLVNQKLLNAEKVQSDFLSNIKNEINNPLTSILGLLKVVTNNPSDHQSNGDITQMIYKEVYNLNFQMRNILTAAEIEAGQAVINVSRFAIKETFTQLVHAHADLDNDINQLVSIELIGDEYFVTDREKLSIIISNLLSNALKFSKDIRKVSIKAKHEENGNLEIYVTDYGVGISENDLKLVFDRFKQLDTGTRKEFSGHGLGLAIVHALVSMLNGTFSLKSSEDTGTTFVVTLPPIGDNLDDSVFYDDDEGILFGKDEGEEEIF